MEHLLCTFIIYIYIYIYFFKEWCVCCFLNKQVKEICAFGLEHSEFYFFLRWIRWNQALQAETVLAFIKRRAVWGKKEVILPKLIFVTCSPDPWDWQRFASAVWSQVMTGVKTLVWVCVCVCVGSGVGYRYCLDSLSSLG